MVMRHGFRVQVDVPERHEYDEFDAEADAMNRLDDSDVAALTGEGEAIQM